MNYYQTGEVAAIIGIHPNTVRLYEEWGLIPRPERRENGYRIFTDLHIAQIILLRTAFRVEILQGGLRKSIVTMVKTAAAGNFSQAMVLTHKYLAQLEREHEHAEEAIAIVQQLLSGEEEDSDGSMKRKEVSEHLGISMDTLRNWEMNGLLAVKRKQNGYRVYTNSDIKKLKIIRSLRCANYSLEAILRLLQQLSQNPDVDIRTALNTPRPTDDIISVCDKLIVSLTAARENAYELLSQLQDMNARF